MEHLQLDFNEQILPYNNGFLKSIEIADFHSVDPFIWVRDSHILVQRMKEFSAINSKVISEAELIEWNEDYKIIINRCVPPSFIKLLESTKKKEQETLLRNEVISSEQMVSLILFAGMRHGYKLSKYSAYHYPNIFPDKIWPKSFHISEGGVIKTVGPTNLTDTQLIQILKQRKLVFARILELNDRWHCFYYNDKSLSGSENYGKPHIHYISNFWTVEKETIIKELANRNYRFNGLHIQYITHRSK